MNKYFYDFHIHSCLSACADNDNTPNNIVGMGMLSGLNVMALTDHNTCKNCPAFFEAARRQGVIPIAGMELTTAEEIHIIFLFEELANAMRFDEYVSSRRVLIKNRVDIFGEQLICDKDDNVIGTDDYLLSNATTISVEECSGLAKRFFGVCYPAHIDRNSNGIIAVLGTFPKDLGFLCAEFNDKNNIAEYRTKYGLEDKRIVVGSDAHYLGNINDAEDYFEISDEPYSGAKVRREIFKILKGEVL